MFLFTLRLFRGVGGLILENLRAADRSMSIHHLTAGFKTQLREESSESGTASCVAGTVNFGGKMELKETFFH